ncbi:MAG: hypothetical protein M1814_003066 [Vezdaea aestivalis]|nr:MAG: hypothetical protein M1814_003066 [Vezdaea aestivalis]
MASHLLARGQSPLQSAAYLPENVAQNIGISVIVPGLVLSAIRIGIRLKQFGKLHADDYLVILAMILTIALKIVYHFGLISLLEVQDLTIRQMYGSTYFKVGRRYMKLQLAGSYVYWTTIWTIKLSVLAFFKRLGNNIKSMEILWWFTMVFTILSYIGSLISYQFFCHSFGILDCIAAKNIRLALLSFRFSTTVDIISDFFIILLPVFLLWNVQIPLKKKLVLISLLCASFIIMGAAGIRFAVVNRKNALPAPQWNAVWCSVEVGVALIVCNLVSFRSLFVAATKTSSGSGSGSKNNSRQGRSGNSFARRFLGIGSGSFFQRSKASTSPSANTGKGFGEASDLETGDSSVARSPAVEVTQMSLGEKGWSQTTAKSGTPQSKPSKERNYDAFLTMSASQEDLTKPDGVLVKTSFGVDHR